MPGVAGTWKDLTDNVNSMASNLTGQVRNIADVATAIARGDLSRKITVDVKGEILELKNTINTMVDQLNAFASEVSRVAREVGTEGKLGGQAAVAGVAGTWKDLTDNVNSMASNLTGQVRNIADVTIAVANGDLSKKITVDVRGEILQLKEAINTMVEQLRSFASEVTRVAREVGTEGRLGVQAVVPGVAGTWKDLTDSVNAMGTNLTAQVRNIAEVTTAVARGDLSRKITVDVKGEILELKNTINTMVDQLNAFAAEVTRVAREVGTEGKLGGQAAVPGVAGTWKDLTDSVNVMAANLTDQVRGIVKVVTAVADGNLRQKLTVEAKGEVAALAETINNMTEHARHLRRAGDQRRPRGGRGRAGSAARPNVPGAAGTWKDLTGNVNLLAANLTNQVRAIAEVATAVTKGDLTRSIQVETRGEVAELKDNINTMIDNLRGTTERNQEQDWLKTNLAKFTRMLQGQRDLVTVGQTLLSELAPLVHAQQGTVYQMEQRGERRQAARCACSPATRTREDQPERIEIGEGAGGPVRGGEAAHPAERRAAATTRGSSSSLGEAQPASVVVLPVLFEGETKAVVELASLYAVHRRPTWPSSSSSRSRSASCSTPSRPRCGPRTCSSSRSSSPWSCRPASRSCSRPTRSWPRRPSSSPSRTSRWSARTRKWSRPAARWRRRPRSWPSPRSTSPSSWPTCPTSCARRSTRSSSSASSSPSNTAGNLTHQAGRVRRATSTRPAPTCSTLINDILDLSKIESGTVTVEAEEITFTSLRDSVERTFHHIAEIEEPAVLRGFRARRCRAPSRSDPKRLQQILKNLLSNAFKFTDAGPCLDGGARRDRGLVAGPPGARPDADRRSPSASRTPASASRRRSRG